MRRLTSLVAQARRTGLRASVARLGRTVRTYGLRDALGRVRAMPAAYTWYRLDLAGERPRRPLEDGLEPVACRDPAGATGYADLQPVTARGAPERFAAGGELWLVRDRGEVLFACWIFGERTPVGGAPGGWLELRPGVNCLEDSVAAPSARGRGIAPGTWSYVADVLASRGVTTLITKVEDDNAASLRSIAKVGFVALTDLDELTGSARDG